MTARRQSARHIVEAVKEPQDTTGAAAGSVVMSGAMSIGSNNIQATFTPVCMDGSSSTTLPVCTVFAG